MHGINPRESEGKKKVCLLSHTLNVYGPFLLIFAVSVLRNLVASLLSLLSLNTHSWTSFIILLNWYKNKQNWRKVLSLLSSCAQTWWLNCLCQSLVSLIVSFLFVPDPHQFPFGERKKNETEIQSSGIMDFKHSSVSLCFSSLFRKRTANGRWYNLILCQQKWTEQEFKQSFKVLSLLIIVKQFTDYKEFLQDDFDWHNMSW